MKRTETGAPLYRFSLATNADFKILDKIFSINGFRINIEKMKKSVVIQCHRCQRFAHTARTCAFRFRCVQCVDTHNPGECPRTTNKNLPLQCINCFSSGLPNNNHSANDLHKCAFFQSKHKTLNQKLVNHQQQQQRTQDAATKSNPINTNTKTGNGKNPNKSPLRQDNSIIDPIQANNPHLNKNNSHKSNTGESANLFSERRVISKNKKPSKQKAGNKNNSNLQALTKALLDLLQRFSNVN